MGIIGCCNKSENENITSSPASFQLIHNFCRGSLRIMRGAGPWGHPVFHPKPIGPLRPSLSATSAHCDRSKFEREKRANRERRSEECRQHQNESAGPRGVSTSQLEGSG